jgi:hypothetical protein
VRSSIKPRECNTFNIVSNLSKFELGWCHIPEMEEEITYPQGSKTLKPQTGK